MFQEELNRSLKLNSGRVAIEKGNESLTFSELLNISNRVTNFLLKENPGTGALIGIELTNQMNLISTIIGVLNARCVFVPLNPELPELRRSAMLGNLNLTHLITSKNDKGLYAEDRINHYYYEDIVNSDRGMLVEDNNLGFQEEDSIYIYFTSGSTGRPKGIVGKNGSLLQFLKWEINEFGIDHTVRASQLISPYFDAFLRDVFVPLLTGGTICIPPDDEDFLSPEKLGSWIDTAEISLIHCVPSVFRVINHDGLSSERFTKLKYILLSGEKIVPSDLLSWYSIFGPRIQLVNLYGATETTMVRSFYRIRPEDARQSRIPIGVPISDTTLLILQKNLEACHDYVPGDLYILSDYAAKGYLNEPELTHEKFIKYQTANDETIAFKTGDKARRLADGQIELIGREDRQIKLRGIRIELEEIENILIQSKLLSQALVTGYTKETGEEILIGFVIRSKDVQKASNLKEVLTDYIKAYLPDYMIPSNLVEVNEYPLLSNGKINYTELLSLQTWNDIVAPENELEERLLFIWKEILGNQPISTEDSFHQIGGSSLALIRLTAKIYKEFNIRISLNELFMNLTIKKQAVFIRKSVKDNALIISKAIEKTAYNLSSAQERMYYHYQVKRESLAFNLPMAWEINGEADVKRIENIMRLLIERHESLRTEFIFDGTRILQVVKDNVDFKIQEIEIQESIVNEKEIFTRLIKPFALNKAPLMRCLIASLKGNRKVLVIDLHHIICDGMSQFILLSDFLRLYEGESLKPLAIQYKDYAEWEYAYKRSDEYLTHREFWLKALEGNIPKVDWPTEMSAPGEMSGEGGNVAFEIEKSTLSAVVEILKQKEITTFSILFSIYFMYLYEFTGQEDLIIGTNTSGRLQDELEDVVGMFAKTLPIRYKIDPQISFRDFVTDLHQYFVEASSRQRYDLIDMVAELNRDRPVLIGDLFETMFVFQNFERGISTSEKDIFSSFLFETTTAKYPISLFASEEGEVFSFRFEYSSLYFTRADIELLSTQFKSLVLKISENLDVKIIECIENVMPSDECQEDGIAFKF